MQTRSPTYQTLQTVY